MGGTTADLILVRVDDPAAGKIWLVSRETLESIPKLYALLESEKPTEASRIRLALLSGPSNTGDVVYAVALLVALNPARVVTSLAVDFSAERAQASLVQAPQSSFQDSLGYTSWHAAQVHDRDPAARLVRVPAATAAFVPRLLCSFPGSHPGGVFRLAC